MSVVIISAPPFTGGEEIAARVADQLGYRLVGDELFETAAKEQGIQSGQLARAVHEPVGWRSMSRRDRTVSLAAIEATLWDMIVEGNCVCHGLAAHLYVERISHILRVRVSGPLERRIENAMEREGLSENRARKLVLGLDKQRRRWVKTLYSVDESDPELFDLVVDLGTSEPGAAVATIAEYVRLRRYRPMSYSRKLARNCTLAAKVRAAVIPVDPDARVRVREGRVHIEVTKVAGSDDLSAALEERARAIAGVTDVRVSVVDDVIAQAALSMR